jgi:twinkle protein
MDEPGRKCALEICTRLGLHRCYIVELPKKDANECLVAGLNREAMMKCLATSKAIELEEIKKPDEFTDEVIEHYKNDPELDGLDTPWTPALPWRIRRSEFTIFSGFSGSGKTIGLNHLIVHLVSKGLKVLDCSLEVRPATTLYYMTRCALGKKHATSEEASACIQWLNDSVLFLDCVGTVSSDKIISAMEYSRKRHGTDIFVIDSLFKCGLSADDWNAQRQFADKLTSFCNSTGAHVILVAHSRKVQSGNEMSIPSKSDIAGSSDLGNAAFNAIVFWRNKKKQRALDEERQKSPPDEDIMNDLRDQPDGKILIDKQRFGGGHEGELFVWYDHDSCQFHTHRDTRIPYFVLQKQ